MFTATYSPDDNKLRLYASVRLDTELYARVKAAGFAWAPKQELFVAPMWTPAREDLAIELAGEIGDEDTSLVDRADVRAERFDGYSDKRAADAHSARRAVAAIADNIPLGQPILIGHHSERHARKDAERIESGMRRAVKMWETSEYWTYRAAGAIAHAKYKELPAVRARRIKKIEADKRVRERARAASEKGLAAWRAVETHEQALRLAGSTDYGRMSILKDDLGGYWTAYDVLRPDGERYATCPAFTVEEVKARAELAYPRTVAYSNRWIAHYEFRLAYEKAMLDAAGASQLLTPKARPALLPLCNYRQASFAIENRWNRGQMETYAQVEMTAKEYAAIYADYKGTRVVDNSHRIRTAVVGRQHVAVFLTDSKTHAKPGTIEAAAATPREQVAPRIYTAPEPNEFDAMKDTLKAGIQVVTAPQLFPTPPDLAVKVVEAAGIEPGMPVLEPSAGTGSLLREAVKIDTEILAYEINPNLCSAIERTFPIYRVKARCADFLEVTEGQGYFDRVIMNPPFANGADIKHILHAVKFLRPGGRLVALCANGPRQRAALMPLAENSGGYWEDLPTRSFAESGTNVNTAMLVIEG